MLADPIGWAHFGSSASPDADRCAIVALLRVYRRAPTRQHDLDASARQFCRHCATWLLRNRSCQSKAGSQFSECSRTHAAAYSAAASAHERERDRRVVRVAAAAKLDRPRCPAREDNQIGRRPARKQSTPLPLQARLGHLSGCRRQRACGCARCPDTVSPPVHPRPELQPGVQGCPLAASKARPGGGGSTSITVRARPISVIPGRGLGWASCSEHATSCPTVMPWQESVQRGPVRPPVAVLQGPALAEGGEVLEDGPIQVHHCLAHHRLVPARSPAGVSNEPCRGEPQAPLPTNSIPPVS